MVLLDFGIVPNLIFVVYSVILVIMVYAKYRKKKGELIRFLLILFIFYAFYLVFNTLQLYLVQNFQSNIAAVITQVFTFPLLPDILSDPIIVAYIVFYTLDLTLAVVTSIIALKFRNMTFTSEEKTRFSRFVNYLGYGTLILAACVILSINNVFLNVVGFFITLHLFLVYIPFTYEAFKTFRRVKEKGLEERYSLGFFFIALMALSFVLRNVFLYIDSLTAYGSGGMLGDPTSHTEFYLIAWIFLIFAFISGYLGYIWPGRKKQ